VTPESFAALLVLQDQGAISGKRRKEVFAELLAKGGDPDAIVDARGLRQVSEVGASEQVVDARSPDTPTRWRGYRAGKKQLLAFFTGQVMKAMKGKGNPAMVTSSSEEARR